MKTTLDIPDDIYRQAKVHAAQHATTLKSLFLQALEKMLREPVAVPSTTRHKKTNLARLPLWMQQSAGMAHGKLTTDAHLREVRGEPL
ncbi:MAG: hypothetical protein WCP45_17575 [Verrucomicrobiota bacterium]